VAGYPYKGLLRPVGECSGDIPPERAYIAYISIYSAYVVQIIGEQFSGTEVYINAPAIGEVVFETDTIIEGELSCGVFIALELAFSAQFAEIVNFTFVLGLRIEIEESSTQKHIGGIVQFLASVQVGKKVEFELRREVHNTAGKVQVAALFVDISGVGVVGCDSTYGRSETERKPVVHIISEKESARGLSAVDPPVCVEVAEIIGGSAPAADFPAAHLC